MKQLTCEMCGGTDLMKQDGVFVCQSCGMKYSVEEAKKMMIEGTVDVSGTVKVDSSDELKNLYEIARRAKDDDNSVNAAKYYDMILIKDPTSWEASFYVVYYKAMQTNIMNMSSALLSVDNCLKGVFQLINNHVESVEEQEKAVKEIMLKVTLSANDFTAIAKNHYLGIDSSIRSKYWGECTSRCNAAVNLMYNCGNYISEVFTSSELKKQAVNIWKAGIALNKEYSSYTTNSVMSYSVKLAALASAHLHVFTKAELEDIKTYAQKVCKHYNGLKQIKTNPAKVYASNMLSSLIIIAIIIAICYLLGLMFGMPEAMLDILAHPISIGIAALLFIIFFFSISASSMPKQSVEELDSNIELSENILKLINNAITKKDA